MKALTSNDRFLNGLTRCRMMAMTALSLAAVIPASPSRAEAGEASACTLTTVDWTREMEARFEKYEGGQFYLTIKRENGTSSPWVGDLTEFNSPSRSRLLELAGLPQPLEKWTPQVIPMQDRKTGKIHEMEVTDVDPLVPNMAPTHVLIKGKWYSLDGIPVKAMRGGKQVEVVGGFMASLATLDAIQAARKLPAGEVMANGYDKDYHIIDGSEFKGIQGTDLEFNTYGAFTIRESDRQLISTGEPVVGPDGEPIKPVHQIERFGRDTLVIHASEGRKYKLVGKSRTAELVATLDTLRRDQFGLLGVQLHGLRRPKDESGSVPQNENHNPIHYLDLGHFHIDREGKFHAQWRRPEQLTGKYEDDPEFPLIITLKTDAVQMPEGARAKFFGTNQFGEIHVVYDLDGQQKICTFGPYLRRRYDENNRMVGVSIEYKMTMNSEDFRKEAEADDVGIDVDKITHVIRNGEAETFFGASGKPKALRVTSNHNDRHCQFMIPTIASPKRDYAFDSPYQIDADRGYGLGVTVEGEFYTSAMNSVSLDLLYARGVDPEKAQELQTAFGRRPRAKDGQRLTAMTAMTTHSDPFGSRDGESAYDNFAKLIGGVAVRVRPEVVPETKYKKRPRTTKLDQ